jgi:hypothetical protein
MHRCKRDNSAGVGVFLVLFFPPAARIFATLRLDKKEPKNQENLTLACAPAGAARKIFGPTHDGSNRRLYWGQRFLFASLWRGKVFCVPYRGVYPGYSGLPGFPQVVGAGCYAQFVVCPPVAR